MDRPISLGYRQEVDICEVLIIKILSLGLSVRRPFFLVWRLRSGYLYRAYVPSTCCYRATMLQYGDVITNFLSHAHC
jgi:hypothetical protein